MKKTKLFLLKREEKYLREKWQRLVKIISPQTLKEIARSKEFPFSFFAQEELEKRKKQKE